MRKIVLYGRLKKLFGGPYNFDVKTAGEAIRALHANFKDFAGELKKGAYQVISGPRKKGMELEEGDINSFNHINAELHIIPVAAGSKRGGVLKTILGVVLIGAAIFFSGGTLAAPLAGMATTIGGTGITWGAIAMIGVGITLAGVSQLLSPKEKSKDQTTKDDSFSFNGPSNATEQGNPVPLIYGRCMVGSIPISIGIDIEDYPIGASPYPTNPYYPYTPVGQG